MARWTIEKEFCFEASHVLPHHDGKCRRLHGHSWKGRLVCEGDRLHESGPQTGMLLDFGRMSAAIKPLLEDHLDHYHLNESLALESPTSEAVARWIFEKVKVKVPELSAVIIDETCTCRCLYRETSENKLSGI